MTHSTESDSLKNANDIITYANLNKEYLNIDAVFSDETENFISNPEPDLGEEVCISIRTYKNNVDRVYIHTSEQEVFELVKTEPSEPSESIFDYFHVKLTIIRKIKYHFSVVKNGQTYYYDKGGLHREADRSFDFVIIPGFKTPDWAKGAVMYQIFVDRFYNGDKSNDVVNNEYAYLGKVAKSISDWNQPVAVDDVCNFYGGDLQGVIEKMGYLKNLGIEVIYFNPIFVSPSNHKYDIQDYDYVDPHYGVIVNDGGSPLTFDRFQNRFATMYMQRTTDIENLEASNALMARLIEIAHENGIRVILDGVFNHCGAFNKWLDKENFYFSNGYPAGAYRNEKSKYHDYFRWYDEAWPNNECYDSWWGHDNHPKLHYEGEKELYNYMLGVGAKWVSPPFNADGWRLDVAADLGYTKELNHQFWRDFRKAVKTANPNAIILAEHYGDPTDWLNGDQWDTVMNYSAFMEPVTWFFTGMEKHSEQFSEEMLCNSMAFEGAMRYFMAQFSAQSLQTAMNELSNHDHSRFMTRTNKTAGRLHTVGAKLADTGLNISVFMAAVAMQMTWPGAPTVYYGDEAGLSGWTDPDNRRTYPWGRENKTLIDFHREIIAIHKNHAALKKGSLEYLYMNYGIISYGRWYGDSSVICAFNNNAESRDISVPVWKANVKLNCTLKKLISTGCDDFNVNNQAYDYTVADGVLKLRMPPFSSIILSN